MRGDKIVSMVEFRRRHNLICKYPTIMLSLNKWKVANEYSERMNVPCLFVVKYDDVLVYIDLTEQPDYFSVGGREDRNDHRDIEPVVHYSVQRLKRINL